VNYRQPNLLKYILPDPSSQKYLLTYYFSNIPGSFKLVS